MRIRRLLSICVLVGTSCAAHVASAQPADRATAAEDLFQRANTLLSAKDYASACPLFAESYRLDPAGGTVQNLAICYEALGRLASAYAKFVDLRDRSSRPESPRPDRVALANEHIKAIEPRLSRVVLAVDVEPGQKAPTVTIDEIDYQAASWSAGILLDPGAHAIVVKAPGKLAYRTSVTITKDGSKEGVRIPRLVDDPAARDAAGTERYRPDAGMRVPGLVIGGIGIAVLAGGAGFGILTITTNNAAKDLCSGTPAPPQGEFDGAGRCYSDSRARRDSNSKSDDARTFANLANVLVPVGAVAIGAGLYLFLRSTRVVERPAAAPNARLVPSLGGASVEGSF
jgi:tetratricopeptide (TPR) repeat protein